MLMADGVHDWKLTGGEMYKSETESDSPLSYPHLNFIKFLATRGQHNKL